MISFSDHIVLQTELNLSGVSTMIRTAETSKASSNISWQQPGATTVAIQTAFHLLLSVIILNEFLDIQTISKKTKIQFQMIVYSNIEY